MQLCTASVALQGQGGTMRATDHQFQQQRMTDVMERQGLPGVTFGVEGFGYEFHVIRTSSLLRRRHANRLQMFSPRSR